MKVRLNNSEYGNFHQLILCSLFAIVLLYVNFCGLYTTHDSEFYQLAAQFLRDNGRLTYFYSSWFQHWPPLYPFILSFFTENFLVYTFLHITCLVVSLWIWLKIGARILQQSWAYYFYALVLSLNTPWLLVGHFIWSEAIFIFLFSSYIFCLFVFVETEKGGWLAGATVFAFLLPWQRVAGAFVFAGVALAACMFFFSLVRKHKDKLAIHTLVSSSSFMSWFIYTTWTLDARKTRPNLSWETIFVSIGKTSNEHLQMLSRWLLPQNFPFFIAYPLMVLCVILPGIYMLKYNHKKGGFLWVLMLTYILLYMISPSVSAEVGGLDETERFLSVIYPIFFLGVAFALKSLLPLLTFKANRLAWLMLFLWLIYPATRLFKNMHFFHERSCGIEKAHDLKVRSTETYSLGSVKGNKHYFKITLFTTDSPFNFILSK